MYFTKYGVLTTVNYHTLITNAFFFNLKNHMFARCIRNEIPARTLMPSHICSLIVTLYFNIMPLCLFKKDHLIEVMIFLTICLQKRMINI